MTGVAPTPALRRTTGPSPGRSVKLPRGALTSSTSPICNLLVDPGARHAMRFPLYADAIAAVTGFTRQGIAAHQRRCAGRRRSGAARQTGREGPRPGEVHPQARASAKSRCCSRESSATPAAGGIPPMPEAVPTPDRARHFPSSQRRSALARATPPGIGASLRSARGCAARARARCLGDRACTAAR